MFGFNLLSFFSPSPLKTFVLGFICGALAILLLA